MGHASMLFRLPQWRAGSGVDFEWMDTEGVPQQGQRFTRDISPKGMFIHSDCQPPAKADVQG